LQIVAGKRGKINLDSVIPQALDDYGEEELDGLKGNA
jgi:hypothetical protein